MKYTIELTNKQKDTFECLLEITRRFIGFNPKLEPIKAVNIEDTNEYQIGYKVGIEAGIGICEKALERLLSMEYHARLGNFAENEIEDILNNNSLGDIIAIIKAYEEKKKAEIKVGDVVTHEKGGIMIVTRVNKITQTISGVCADGEYFDRDMAKWHKTGKHYDIESILKELGE